MKKQCAVCGAVYLYREKILGVVVELVVQGVFPVFLFGGLITGYYVFSVLSILLLFAPLVIPGLGALKLDKSSIKTKHAILKYRGANNA